MECIVAADALAALAALLPDRIGYDGAGVAFRDEAIYRHTQRAVFLSFQFIQELAAHTSRTAEFRERCELIAARAGAVSLPASREVLAALICGQSLAAEIVAPPGSKVPGMAAEIRQHIHNSDGDPAWLAALALPVVLRRHFEVLAMLLRELAVEQPRQASRELPGLH